MLIIVISIINYNDICHYSFITSFHFFLSCCFLSKIGSQFQLILRVSLANTSVL